MPESFISLDHTWTAWTSDGHPGKEYLDRFAYYMHATEPQMEWHVDYHPYSIRCIEMISGTTGAALQDPNIHRIFP